MPKLKTFVCFVGAVTLVILVVRGGVVTFHLCVPPAGCVYSQKKQFQVTGQGDAPAAFQVGGP